MFEKKEEKPEEKKAEVKKPEAPKGKNPLDEKKIEKDHTNEGTFVEGEIIKLKDLEFVVHKVGGLELILKRKDFV